MHQLQVEAVAGGVETHGRWFGPSERPLLGWLTTPLGGVTGAGVLILPPVGAEYWSTHRTLRVLAERLAGDGHTVLRLDYDGTGDSAGDQWEDRRLGAWRRSAIDAAAELRALGCERLCVVGVRLGATLALLDGEALDADEIVAWAPVASGRRYTRELRMLGEALPGPDDTDEGAAAIEVAGTVFQSETLSELSTLDLRRMTATPAPRVLLVGGGQWAAAQLCRLDCEVTHEPAESGELALERPAEEAEVPDDLLDSIRSWVSPADDVLGAGHQPTERPSAVIDWRGGRLAETVVDIGPDHLVGVLTEPLQRDSSPFTLVFLNSGSEHHVGPGRAWTEYARDLALAGHRGIRVDFHDWGESPDAGHVPGRPYDAHCQDDVTAIIRALARAGHERIVLVGLCAAAWTALRVVRHEPVSSVVALNPQLYWQPGDPVEVTMAETHRRRREERRRERRGQRLRVWTLLDLLGHRPWAARWLDELAATDVRVLALFAEGDDGIDYLRTRFGRRLRKARAGGLDVVEIPDIDHPMHRAWLRPRVVAAIRNHLAQIS